MKSIGIVEIERHKRIVSHCNALLKLVKTKDKELINEILNNSKSIIDTNNLSKLEVTNPTLIEIGRFNAVCKKLVRSKYGMSKIKKLEGKGVEYWEARCEIYNDFDKALNNTIIKTETRDKYILLMRSAYNSFYYNDLQKAIRDSIHIEVLTQFQEQNEELINKYI